jgi:hypothetical protein
VKISLSHSLGWVEARAFLGPFPVRIAGKFDADSCYREMLGCELNRKKSEFRRQGLFCSTDKRLRRYCFILLPRLTATLAARCASDARFAPALISQAQKGSLCPSSAPLGDLRFSC